MSELVAKRSESVLPTMQTRRVRLRRVADGDGPFLYDLMTSLTAGGRVRYGGATPSPEKVLQGMWESVLAQFIIEGTSSQTRMGVVAITSVNFRDGFAYFSVLGTEAARGRGLLGEGTFLGLHYAFSTWPFRKIYMEASDASMPAFEGALDRYFVEEGRLRQHTYWNGSYLDVRVCSPCTARPGLRTRRDSWSGSGVRTARTSGTSPTNR